MTDLLISLAKMALMLLPFLLLTRRNAKVNLKRETRDRQFLMPIAALIYSIILLIYLDKLYALANSILEQIPTWIEKLGNWLSTAMDGKLSGIASPILNLADKLKEWFANLNLAFWAFFLTNLVLMVIHLMLKRVLIAVFSLLFRNDGSFHDAAVKLFYTKDEVTGRWTVWTQLSQGRLLLKIFYVGAVVLSAIAMLASGILYREGLMSAPYYPVFCVILIGEVYFFLDGLTKQELHHELTGEEDDADSRSDYSLMRKVLRKLFPDKLNAENTTINDSMAAPVTNDEVLETLESDPDTMVEAYGSFMRAKTAAGMELDHDFLKSGLQLLNGESILFNDPFYYDLIPYAFYPLNRTLLRHKKVLVILGRHGMEEDAEVWCRTGLTAVTNVPDMWNIGVLNGEEQDLDVGIMTRSSVHDLKLHETNREFFRKVEFVVLLEPSRLLTTAQVGLNSVVRYCREGKKRLVFCSTDKNCDGLLDALSHVLMTSLREVSATNHHRGTSSYMCWDADDEHLQHRLLPNLSRYLGMGTELSFVALKNQISETSWYGGDAFPVEDMHWVAKQYYYDLLHYAELPAAQETMDQYFKTHSGLWDARVRNRQYMTVEDEAFNMFEVKRDYSTRALEQGFINVISSEYLLKDYMSANDGIFNADPKAIPYITADYDRTARNVALRTCLRMSSGMVSESELHRELLMIDMDSDHPEESLWQVIWENCQNVGERETDRDNRPVLHRMTSRGPVVFSSDVIRRKRRFSMATGQMETVYFITDARFIDLVLADMQSAEYIAEDENGERMYLGSELRGHVFQKYLPGQFFTMGGKYYEMIRVTMDGKVLVRRAADHINDRQSYRQVRNYYLSGVRDSQVMGDSKDLGAMSITRQFADIRVETPAYWRMNRYNDFTTGVCVSINGVPARRYSNKQILRIDLKHEESMTPEICRTVAQLFNEVMRSLFAENQDYIVAVTANPAELPVTYSITGEDGFAPRSNSIYIIEDSQMDVGLLVAVERNLNRIFAIICDYLDWNREAVEASLNPPPAPEVPDYTVPTDAPEAETKKKGFFKRIGSKIAGFFKKIGGFFKKLFGRKKKKGQEPEEVPETDPSVPVDTPEGEQAVQPVDPVEVVLQPEVPAEETTEAAAPQEPAAEQSAEEPTANGTEPLMSRSVLFDADPAEDVPEDEADELVFEGEVALKPSTIERKPYHERYFLLYGGEAVPASLDLEGTSELLKALGYGHSALRQARDGKNIADMIERSFVPNRAGSHYCDFCGCELMGMEFDVLGDGRERCVTCGRTAVKTAEEFKSIHEHVVRNMMAFYGIRITAPVKIQMVNAKKLHKKLGKTFVPSGKHDGRILGVAIHDKEGYSILMENGAPRIQSTMTMVHEMTHIWQYLNWDSKQILNTYGKDLNLEIYEGMAKWSEIQYAYLLNETAAAKREEMITRARDDEYGRGFVKYAGKYPLRTTPGSTGTTPFDDHNLPL